MKFAFIEEHYTINMSSSHRINLLYITFFFLESRNLFNEIFSWESYHKLTFEKYSQKNCVEGGGGWHCQKHGWKYKICPILDVFLIMNESIYVMDKCPKLDDYFELVVFQGSYFFIHKKYCKRHLVENIQKYKLVSMVDLVFKQHNLKRKTNKLVNFVIIKICAYT